MSGGRDGESFLAWTRSLATLSGAGILGAGGLSFVTTIGGFWAYSRTALPNAQVLALRELCASVPSVQRVAGIAMKIFQRKRARRLALARQLHSFDTPSSVHLTGAAHRLECGLGGPV